MKVLNDSKNPIKLWADYVHIEDEAISQLKRTADLPFIFSHIAVMPDAHSGKGSTVGSVIPTLRAIIPAAVGVDIGCGMVALQTTLTAKDLPDSLAKIRSEIERFVPHGRTDNGGVNDRGAYNTLPTNIVTQWKDNLEEGYNKLISKHPQLAKKTVVNQLGTLGTGNHFIEVCLDEKDNVWIMLHSGSRGIGNAIGSYFIARAKEEDHKMFLPDKDLSFLTPQSPHFAEYVDAVMWAQGYASKNREIMLNRVTMILRKELSPFQIVGKAINCHHNYVAIEDHFGESIFVTRKGAIRAQKGDLGIIPGSMGARSFIVSGKGNSESFNSCSHGAGRSMSRTKAKATFTLQDHIEATKGIECRKDEDVIDETPKAYKDIELVMKSQEDLVDIVHTLRQVLCVKG